jgi:sensor histidine kinase regulating citrate/malate metabolism
MRRLGQKTIWERNWLTSSTPDSTEPKHQAESFVWATSEKTRLRALSLYLIRSIVERHGGTIDIDLVTDTISIDVPKKEEVTCALEIEEQVGNICW